jgi:putative ABC transport system permease protein
VQPGFTHPEQVQLLHIVIPDTHVKDSERVARMENEMIDKLAAIPGVTAAGFTSGAPLEGISDMNDLVYAEDKSYAAGEIPPIRAFRFISPGFLKVDGTPLIAGRDFTWTDVYERRYVVMVSENLAREMWGSSQAALGKRIREGPKDPWREVVGVVGNVYDKGIEKKAPTVTYWPILLKNFEADMITSTRFGALAIRTNRAGTESLLTEARQAIWSVDSNLPIFLVRTMKDVYDASMARTSFTLVLLAIAGTMALVLGVVGIYGVIAYAVTQRTREIGIRMALGAEARELRGMFVRQGLVLAAVGAAMGLVAAAGLTRWMSSLLFKTAALDPATYIAVSLLLILAAALASYVPARRATAVDPLVALRTD